MALNPQDFLKLTTMQSLSDQAVEDVQKIKDFIANFLADQITCQVQLEQLYTDDWYRITESETPSPEQIAALQAQIKPGRYSVLDQDTIWDLLNELNEAKLQLLKALVDQL